MSITFTKITTIGSQLSTAAELDNKSNVYITELDVSSHSYTKMAFEVKVTNINVSPGATKDFTLYWGFCSETITTDAPTFLATTESSLACRLADATTTTRYYHSAEFSPVSKFMCVWYDCDDLTDTGIPQIDITLARLAKE